MKREEKKPTTAFAGQSQPYVDPAVAARNPAAAAYAQSLAQRNTYAEPRGGGAPPPIPRLDAPHQEGATMADQAMAQRMPPQQPAGIFAEGALPAPEAQSGILQNDILPQQAKQDEAFREGHGSLYAVNQPHLARKYGVIRQGRHIPPQELGGQKGLSGRTVEGLQAVAEFQKTRQSAESGDAAAERAAREGIAGEAAKVAGGEDARPVTEEQKKEAERAMQTMDEFDFNTFREVMMKDLVNNDEQRAIVEERLQPLDLSELIMNGRVQQAIPIVPGKYEPTFQSFTGEEELSLKRLLMQERKNIEAPDRYLLDKFQLMTVALGVAKLTTSRGTTALPPHLNQAGEFDDELFWAKFNRVLKLPFHMLASMGVHYYWFDVRVRKLFVAERLKNG